MVLADHRASPWERYERDNAACERLTWAASRYEGDVNGGRLHELAGLSFRKLAESRGRLRRTQGMLEALLNPQGRRTRVLSRYRRQ